MNATDLPADIAQAATTEDLLSAVRATAQPSGLPPNVLPCEPGPNTPSTSRDETTADTG